MEKKTINYEMMADLVDKDIKPYLAKNPTIRILVNGTPSEIYDYGNGDNLSIYKGRKYCVLIITENNKRTLMQTFERV